MKHRIKRIFISLFARKKASLMMLILMVILSFFMLISYTTKLSNQQILAKLKTNMEVSLSFKGDFFNAYANVEKPINYSASTHLNRCVKFESTIKTSIKDLPNVTFENIYSLSLNSDDYVVGRQLFSYDERIFYDENYELVEGRIFDEYDINNHRNVALVKAQQNDYIVGDIIKLAGEEYEIIGSFQETSGKMILPIGEHYNQNALFIILEQNLLDLSSRSEAYIQMNAPKVVIKGDQDILAIQSTIENAIKDQTDLFLEGSFEIESNESLTEALKQPFENIGMILDFISISMFIISILILLSFIIYIARKRADDFKVFHALGQSMSMTYMEYLLEVLLIANLAFFISLPISIQISNQLSSSMIRTNIQRQMRIAEMASVDKSYEILKEEENVYQAYALKLESKDYLKLFILNNTVVIMAYPVLLASGFKKRKV